MWAFQIFISIPVQTFRSKETSAYEMLIINIVFVIFISDFL